jgi:GntR family transcriptional regulator
MITTTNARRGVTRYFQIYTVLAQALAETGIAAGEALPSESTLARTYGVSRTTVRRALARLAAEGSIGRRRGSGTFALGRRERLASARQLVPIPDDLRSIASNTDERVLAFERVPTPEFLRREWRHFGETALLIRRIRYLEDDPVLLSATYVPEPIARGLTRRRLGRDPVLVALGELGFRAVTGEQETNAIAADPVTARYLNLDVGAVLLNVKRLVRDSKDRIIEWTNFLYRPDRYELHTVIERTIASGGRNGGRKKRRS